MIHEIGKQILNSLEKRIGHLALPHILRLIAGFQALTWGLSRFSRGLIDWLEYDTKAILGGEVWRLISWVLLPIDESVIFVLFALFFMFFISDSLERAWGSFRVNVYVFFSIASLALIGLVPFFTGAGPVYGDIFYSVAFLAFATLFPNQVINLLAVIPIKAKWLGLANGALLIAMILGSNAPFLLAIVVIAGMLPYLVVFVPEMVKNAKQNSENTVRRHKFVQAAGGEAEPFHQCEKCGANDETHPERDFRVTVDGKEICSECRSES